MNLNRTITMSRDYTKEFNLLLKEDLDLLKSLLNLTETQKSLIQSSKRERINRFVSDKEELLERLTGIESDIEVFKKKYPGSVAHLASKSKETGEIIKEIKRVVNKISEIEEKDRKDIYNEIVMTKSLLKNIRKGKHSLNGYRINKNKEAKFVNTVK